MGSGNAEAQRAQRYPPPVFLQKSVQGVEKKGRELQKEPQERGKSLQEYENNEFTTEVTESTEKGER